jgi:putative transposase
MTRKELAKQLGISRSSLYYKHKQLEKDRAICSKIKIVMRQNPSYGHRRVALALGINHKSALRIMKKFNLSPRLKRIKHKSNFSKPSIKEANLIKNICATAPSEIWASDFTYIRFRNQFVYLTTVIDVFSRKILGWNLSLKADTKMVLTAIEEALATGSPKFFHTDRGSPFYDKKIAALLKKYSIKHSRSDKSSPWQNSWQESFFSQFKLELEGTGRFKDFEELVDGINNQIVYYNEKRIHTALGKSPSQFLSEFKVAHKRIVQVSKKMGT